MVQSKSFQIVSETLQTDFSQITSLRKKSNEKLLCAKITAAHWPHFFKTEDWHVTYDISSRISSKNIYLFKISNRQWIWSKLSMKTTEWRHWRIPHFLKWFYCWLWTGKFLLGTKLVSINECLNLWSWFWLVLFSVRKRY